MTPEGSSRGVGLLTSPAWVVLGVEGGVLSCGEGTGWMIDAAFGVVLFEA